LECGIHAFFLARHALLVPGGVAGQKFGVGLQVTDLAVKLVELTPAELA
jgi:hypothetical protein